MSNKIEETVQDLQEVSLIDFLAVEMEKVHALEISESEETTDAIIHNISTPIYLKHDYTYLVTLNDSLYHLVQGDIYAPMGLWDQTMKFISENPSSVKTLKENENPPEVQKTLEDAQESSMGGAAGEIVETEIESLGYTQSEINSFMAAMMDNMGLAQLKKEGKSITEAIEQMDFTQILGDA